MPGNGLPDDGAPDDGVLDSESPDEDMAGGGSCSVVMIDYLKRKVD
jgi:hypothetical protein